MFVVSRTKKGGPARRMHLHKASNRIPNNQLFTKATCKAGLHFVKKLASVFFFVLGFAIC